MALNKNINYNGITLDYHKITDVIQDFKNGKCVVVVASYIDQNARIADINSMFKTAQYAIDIPDLTRAQMYEQLKLTEDFADAFDQI